MQIKNENVQSWHQAVGVIKRFVVKIETPSGHGTGFVVPAPAGRKNASCLVTAYHVIEHAYKWNEPIRIVYPEGGRHFVLDSAGRTIIPAIVRDQAIIEFSVSDVNFPVEKLEFTDANEHYLDGNSIGWIGFPALVPDNACFFRGVISSYVGNSESYLVDGVAINGVSGGPSFVLNAQGKVVVIGLVTEYHPNVATGKTLPGMSVVRSINPLIRYYNSELKKYAVPKAVPSVTTETTSVRQVQMPIVA